MALDFNFASMSPSVNSYKMDFMLKVEFPSSTIAPDSYTREIIHNLTGVTQMRFPFDSASFRFIHYIILRSFPLPESPLVTHYRSILNF